MFDYEPPRWALQLTYLWYRMRCRRKARAWARLWRRRSHFDHAARKPRP